MCGNFGTSNYMIIIYKSRKMKERREIMVKQNPKIDRKNI